jgi:hypothetical protein
MASGGPKPQYDKDVRKNLWNALGVLVLLVAMALFAEYWFRCHGNPLDREEAVRRADKQLWYLSRDWVLGNPLPALAEEQYDASDGSWRFTYRNATCEVSIITDRCNGTDIGGVSEGCTKHRGQPEKLTSR